MGSCVYHVSTQSVGQWFRNLKGNTEHKPLTKGTYTARELAMTRMEAEANQVQAEGIVAVQVREINHGWGSHIIEFFALGTAVVRDHTARAVADPAMVMTLGS